MKRLTRLQKNLLFAAVLLLAAVVLFWALRGRKQGEVLVAVADFGDGITETIPLDKDYDYLYDVGDYVVHLQVKDGAIAFQDSQCDHALSPGIRFRMFRPMAQASTALMMAVGINGSTQAEIATATVLWATMTNRITPTM